MFDKMKEKYADIKYGGIKFAISQSLEYAKENPGKVAASIALDVATMMTPSATLGKAVLKKVTKTVVKSQINK